MGQKKRKRDSENLVVLQKISNLAQVGFKIPKIYRTSFMDGSPGRQALPSILPSFDVLKVNGEGRRTKTMMRVGHHGHSPNCALLLFLPAV